MERKKVYFVAKDNDHINFLGENGWFIFTQDPLIICHEFTMRDGEHLDNFKQKLTEAANYSEQQRKFLSKECGFKTRRVKSESSKSGYQYVIDDWSSLFDWRIEFNYYEDNPMVYITFGPSRLNAPAIAAKDIIDGYVPKEIMEQALNNGSIFEGEVETED